MSIEQTIREIVRQEMSKSLYLSLLTDLVTNYQEKPKPITRRKNPCPYMPLAEARAIIESKAIWTLQELQAATPATYSGTASAWRGRVNKLRRMGTVGEDTTGKIYALAKSQVRAK